MNLTTESPMLMSFTKMVNKCEHQKPGDVTEHSKMRFHFPHIDCSQMIGLIIILLGRLDDILIITCHSPR